MQCNEVADLCIRQHENAAVAPFVSKTLKRFLETSTDKKKQYLASLEKKLSAKNSGNTTQQ